MKKALGMMVAAILIGTFITANSSIAGEKARDGRFIAYENDTVLDTKTTLMWATKDNGSALNWVNARYYCISYRGGGYTDWRMPTQDELAGLYDQTITYNTDNGRTAHLTKLILLTSAVLWASESSIPPHTNAISRNDTSTIFIFTKGKRLLIRSESTSDTCVLPVRSIK